MRRRVGEMERGELQSRRWRMGWKRTGGDLAGKVDTGREKVKNHRYNNRWRSCRVWGEITEEKRWIDRWTEEVGWDQKPTWEMRQKARWEVEIKENPSSDRIKMMMGWMTGEERSTGTERLWGTREKNEGKILRRGEKWGKRQTSQNEWEEEEKRNRCWKWQSEDSQHADSGTKTREMDQQTGNEERKRKRIWCSGNREIMWNRETVTGELQTADRYGRYSRKLYLKWDIRLISHREHC